MVIKAIIEAVLVFDELLYIFLQIYLSVLFWRLGGGDWMYSCACPWTQVAGTLTVLTRPEIETDKFIFSFSIRTELLGLRVFHFTQRQGQFAITARIHFLPLHGN